MAAVHRPRQPRAGQASAPFAPRSSVARRSSDYPRSLARSTRPQRPSYNALSDPHLKRYFRNKLTPPPPASKPGTPTPTGTTSQGTPSRTRESRSQACYRVSVKTGSQSGAGTDARVFITLHGSQGKLGKKRLVRGGGAEGMRFAEGSLERLRVRGPAVGELRQVTVEHNGLKEQQAWFLEHLTVTEEGSGLKWHFPCGQWLSLHHHDCQLSRTLPARPLRVKPGAEVEYRVEVATGDVRGGGTDAAVFLTLTGTRGSSPKTKLQGCTFERGAVEEARLVCRDLGTLKTATLEHDNTGFGPDWFLEKVVVHSSSQPERRVLFPCNQWLSRDEGDGSTSRTLHPSPSTPLPSQHAYQITTRTGDMRGAGTSANVFVTLYGSEGNSGERRLDNDIKNFERGRKDLFRFQCTDLGRIERVRVRHDNTGVGPGWFLEWVEVCQCEDGKVWRLPCGRWLDAGEGEGEGVLQCELRVGAEGETKQVATEGHPYTLHVSTGEQPGAGTSASVYVVVQGGGVESGRLWLESAGRTLLPGQTDLFSLLSPRLVSPVETLTIGHDGSGPSPGWFLEKVVLEGGRGERLEFPCHRWLCLDCDDGRIERELHPSVCGQEDGGREWRVTVWTSDIRGAGTDANVTIQVHGQRGSSAVLPLGNSIDNFEQGERDSFLLSLPDISPVTAITVAHDNTNPYPEWHLDRVQLEPTCPQLEPTSYVFPCNQWLSTTASTSVKIPATPLPGGGGGGGGGAEGSVRKDQNPSQAVSLDGDSGEEGRGAGGEGRGADGEDSDSYGSDQFDSLEESDGEERDVISPVQQLDSTITNEYIQQLKFAQMSSLDSSQAHSGTQSPLHPTPPRIPPSPGAEASPQTIPYTVHLTVGSRPPGNSRSHLTISLVGEGGVSPPIPLEVVQRTGPAPNSRETFSVEGRDVGGVSALRLWLAEGEEGERWRVDEVAVHSPTTGRTYLFPWGKWAESGQQYCLEAAELESSGNTSTLAPSTGTPSTESGLVAYEVKVVTADKKHAGTSNDLHLVVAGNRGVSREFVTRNTSRGPKFQRGQTDSFQVATPALGRLTSVRVAHCPRKGRREGQDPESSRWYLFQVVLTQLTDSTRYCFLHRQWVQESAKSAITYTEVPLSKTK